MSNSLTDLDYFLFDNITPTFHGRDWGIKASTGILEQDKNLKEMFYSYCRLIFETSPGSLGKFGHALGGFNLPKSRGYILCVILENKDHVNRNSLAVIGMHFEKHQDLLAFLIEHDPIRTAKQVFEQPALPAKLRPIAVERKGDASLDNFFPHWKVKKRNDAAFLAEFETTQSSKLAAGVLVGCINNGMGLPSILGITIHPNSALIKKAGLDIAFCKPTNPSTASFLNKIIESQTNMAEKPWPEIQKAEHPKQFINTASHRKSSPSPNRRKLIIIVIGFLIFFAILVRITMVLHDSSGSTTKNIKPTATKEPTQSEKPDTSHISLPNREKQELPGINSWDEFLNQTRELLDQLDALNPEELKQSSIYKTIMGVTVCQEFQDKRNTLLNFIKLLPDYKKRLVGLNLRYFCDGSTFKDSAQQLAIEIKKNIKTLNLPDDLCNPLVSGFRYEFRKKTDFLVKWYNIISGFRDLAK